MEVIWNGVNNIVNVIELGLAISGKVYIDDLSLETAPRAFYNLQNSYSETLIPLMMLIIFADAAMLFFAIRSFIRLRNKEVVSTLEHSPLQNYCLSQSFVFLTRTFAQFLLVFFSSFCIHELTNIKKAYEFSDFHDDTINDIEEVNSILISLATFLIMSIFGHLCLCSLGCFSVGKREYTKK